MIHWGDPYWERLKHANKNVQVILINETCSALKDQIDQQGTMILYKYQSNRAH